MSFVRSASTLDIKRPCLPRCFLWWDQTSTTSSTTEQWSNGQLLDAVCSADPPITLGTVHLEHDKPSRKCNCLMFVKHSLVDGVCRRWIGSANVFNNMSVHCRGCTLSRYPSKRPLQAPKPSNLGGTSWLVLEAPPELHPIVAGESWTFSSPRSATGCHPGVPCYGHADVD